MTPDRILKTANLDKLFHPHSVALVGASSREGTSGQRVLGNLLKGGFGGAVYPVNPRYEELQGVRCYPSLAALPEIPDLVFAAIPAAGTAELLAEAGRLGVGAMIVNASGFAEAGPAGREAQEELVRLATTYGVALCGPNNNGLMNFVDGIMPIVPMPQADIKIGPVAVISHSGTMSFSLGRDKAGVGLAYIVSAGNEATLSSADYLDYFVGDPCVGVILMFLETIRRPEAFAAAADKAAALGKPVIAVKIGRTSEGQAAIAAHTGNLAGQDDLYDAYFRRHGIVRTDDLEEMIETSALFAAYKKSPTIKNVAAITSSGGQAALIADLGAKLGVSIPPLSSATKARLAEIYPAGWTPGNPIDAWALGWDAKRFARTVAILAEDEDIGLVLPVVEPRPYGNNKAIAEICRSEAARTGKPFAFLNDASGGEREPAVRPVLAEAGIPYLSGVRNALAGIARWMNHRGPEPTEAIADGFRQRARSFALKSSRLGEPARFSRLAELGVPMSACVAVATAEDAQQAAARLGYPLVVKGCAPDLPHKMEHGLVALDLATPDAVAQAFASVQENLDRSSHSSLATVAVQPQLRDGIELIIGIRNDPHFGALVVVGLGGTYVELLRETSKRLGPVTPAIAREMLDETPAGKLLAGYRGRGPFDIDAAAEAISALSQFGAATSDIVAAIEINPLIVLPAGKGAFGVDAVIELTAKANLTP